MGARFALNFELRTPNAERRTPNAERRTRRASLTVCHSERSEESTWAPTNIGLRLAWTSAFEVRRSTFSVGAAPGAAPPVPVHGATGHRIASGRPPCALEIAPKRSRVPL